MKAPAVFVPAERLRDKTTQPDSAFKGGPAPSRRPKPDGHGGGQAGGVAAPAPRGGSARSSARPGMLAQWLSMGSASAQPEGGRAGDRLPTASGASLAHAESYPQCTGQGSS